MEGPLLRAFGVVSFWGVDGGVSSTPSVPVRWGFVCFRRAITTRFGAACASWGAKQYTVKPALQQTETIYELPTLLSVL